MNDATDIRDAWLLRDPWVGPLLQRPRGFAWRMLRCGLGLLIRGRWAGPPVRAQVEPTSRCNLTCSYCPRTRGAPPVPGVDMAPDFFRHVLDELGTVRTLQLSGYGEPLLHEALPDLVAEARARGTSVEVTTNGTLLDARTVRRLLAAGPTKIKVSLDSADPAACARERGVDPDRVAKGMRTLADCRGSARLPRLWVNAVAIPGDPGDAGKALADLARACGFDAVRVKTRSEIGSPGRCAGASGGRPQSTACAGPACYAPWMETYVDAHGALTPCCEFARGVPCMGRLDQECFSGIWQSARDQRFRRVMARRVPRLPQCQVCNRRAKTDEIASRLPI